MAIKDLILKGVRDLKRVISMSNHAQVLRVNNMASTDFEYSYLCFLNCDRLYYIAFLQGQNFSFFHLSYLIVLVALSFLMNLV